MRNTQRLFTAVAAFILVAGPLQATPSQQWDFSGVDRIEIEGVSGDIEVRAGTGSDVAVELQSEVTPSDAFSPEVEQSGATLHINETWRRGR